MPMIGPKFMYCCRNLSAIQYLEGMSNPKVIIAIKIDLEVNIFNIADYRIVGELFEVIPLLTKKKKKLK